LDGPIGQFEKINFHNLLIYEHSKSMHKFDNIWV